MVTNGYQLEKWSLIYPCNGMLWSHKQEWGGSLCAMAPKYIITRNKTNVINKVNKYSLYRNDGGMLYDIFPFFSFGFFFLTVWVLLILKFALNKTPVLYCLAIVISKGQTLHFLDQGVLFFFPLRSCPVQNFWSGKKRKTMIKVKYLWLSH